jgi:hypothetical protein
MIMRARVSPMFLALLVVLVTRRSFATGKDKPLLAVTEQNALSWKTIFPAQLTPDSHVRLHED